MTHRPNHELLRIGDTRVSSSLNSSGLMTSAAPLVARAHRLRAIAVVLNPILADAYRRRAAELSLEAWARAAGSVPVAVDDFTVAAA